MNELNQDGLVPDQAVSFEELKRIESERNKFRNDPALLTHLSQTARRKRKKEDEEVAPE